ncbi:polysaccharide biosynthesis protein [Acidaminobacter sp. JC074]|uniref:nucleoside-diphosphate sugar epimerase/dehydratase n=1 Tax=Acidaminobacter sp. JC074 TaxID=2530199 RepID=UPI001F0DA250|nr:nucleoside-diphosphate sugar epimerase/dehydratase [Acidaminobacter sp. JC074]MCH4889709.1 polysaccharide biosynthesis protein [Acidaminobacter sp. JC074]
MSTLSKKMVMLLLDALVISTSFLLALVLKYDLPLPGVYIDIFYSNILIYLLLKLIVFRVFSLYSSMWSYASIEEVMRGIAAVLVASMIGIFYLIYQNSTLPLSFYLITLLIEMIGVLGVRLAYRVFRRIKNVGYLFHKDLYKNVLIIGVGATASMIAKELKEHPNVFGHLVGFIGKENNMIGQYINGVKVLGNRYDIYSIVKRYKVDEIILAIPAESSKVVKEIMMECSKCNCKVKTVPGIHEIIDGKVSVHHIRDVNIEDLLGRDPVQLDKSGLNELINGKTIMVTGGGGSIGSEICRQLMTYEPRKLIIVDNYENNAYDITNELKQKYGMDMDVVTLIATVQDFDNIMNIFSTYRPQLVFHAAAHKHVPLMEHAPREAVLNNCMGTFNVVKAAANYHVEKFVFISTDKAVNPTSVMGATKRICEMIVQSMTDVSDTVFTTVRFGNVLGSNGSVIPLFENQIKAGGPVTVTHKNIIRYFMTIPEAVQLVLQSGAFAKNNEVFVLDMGEPVNIYALAENLIRLLGYEPGKDIQIEIIGLRPGEKLYEELLLEEEGLVETSNKKIYIGKTTNIDFDDLCYSLERLKSAAYRNNNMEIKRAIQKLVPNYHIDEEEVSKKVISIKKDRKQS